MTLSWNEIRARANKFVKEWAGETRERAEKDTFWNDFFDIYGVTRRRVAVFEQLSQRHSTGNRGFMDVFYPGVLAAEHKSAGEDMATAMDQAIDYLPAIPDEHLPRLVVVCNFDEFWVRDLDTDEVTKFPLEDLPKHVEMFGAIAGYHRTGGYATEEDVNLAATALLANVHDSLKANGYDPHDLREFMVRLLFLLFADDTQVWERGLFHDYLTLRTRVDGSDLGAQLALLFQTLNQAPADRPKNLDEALTGFTYINGSLFANRLPIASTDRAMREALLKASLFDWGKISPAIFGSMFQNVMTGDERRSLGAHYTTEENILRTIRPLFVDDLRAELNACSDVRALHAFQDKLASLTFMDPAAGCGNFLVIAYREIRDLELECLIRIRDAGSRMTARGARRKRTAGPGDVAFDATLFSKVHVGQFYGIEIEEFPARIASTAMYLIDHLANLKLSAEFGTYYARFPIADSPTIVIGNACEIDWVSVLPADECDYLFGNPPFRGRQYRTAEQKADMAHVFSRRPGHAVLDYVTAWFAMAGAYIKGGGTQVGFVATNSITQGEQAAALWSHPSMAGVHIHFAHRTFAWKSEARGKAHVHVVIVGMMKGAPARSLRLFDYPDPKGDPVEVAASNINAYLVDAPNVLITKSRKVIAPGMPAAVYGSMANDDQNLLVTEAEYDQVAADPIAAKYLRPYVGSDEMIQGKRRWCLWLKDAEPADLRTSPVLRERLAKVRAYRQKSNRAATANAAATPSLFVEIREQHGDFLLVPFVSSERREHLPVSFYDKNTIPAAPHWVVPGRDLAVFGVLTSSLFTTWLRTVAGKLESRLRMSPGTVYNTFPFPSFTAETRAAVERAAQAVLDVRDRYSTSTLADLYDPDATPPDLVKAFQELDRAVLRAYGVTRRLTEEKQQELLFTRYTELTTGSELPLAGEPARRPRRRRA